MLEILSALIPVGLVEYDEYDRIVDHDSRKPDHPQHSQYRNIQSQKKMSPHSTDDSEWNGQHHDKGPDIGTEGKSQGQVDQHHRQDETQHHRSFGFFLISLPRADVPNDTMLAGDFRSYFLFKMGQSIRNTCEFGIDARVDLNREISIRVSDRVKSSTATNVDDIQQRDRFSRWQDNVNILKFAELMLLAVRQHEFDIDVLILCRE